MARTIDALGVYDLVVTEAIWRLVRPGDVVLDVGANVGYMTLALASRLGTAGTIFSFEPHPGLFEELSENVGRARDRFPGVRFAPNREALSDRAGTAWLSSPEDAHTNRGLARLGPGGEGFEVATRCLDEYAEALGPTIALMKLDVEGHEPAVLKGGKKLLGSGTIRNVIVEEHGAYPTESSRLLEGFGYTIVTLERTLFRPRLGDPAHPRRATWEAPSLLATLDPAAARSAFRRLGWRALRG